MGTTSDGSITEVVDDALTTRTGGRASAYGDDRIRTKWLWIPVLSAGAALLPTIGVLAALPACAFTPSPALKAAFLTLWAFWVIAPPIWFAFEYFYLFKKFGRVDTFEAFKYGQEIASRAWLGIAALMSVLATMIR